MPSLSRRECVNSNSFHVKVSEFEGAGRFGQILEYPMGLFHLAFSMSVQKMHVSLSLLFGRAVSGPLEVR